MASGSAYGATMNLRRPMNSTVHLRRGPLNMSIDTDPQQQKAASPQVLVVRSFLRYTCRTVYGI